MGGPLPHPRRGAVEQARPVAHLLHPLSAGTHGRVQRPGGGGNLVREVHTGRRHRGGAEHDRGRALQRPRPYPDGAAAEGAGAAGVRTADPADDPGLSGAGAAVSGGE